MIEYFCEVPVRLLCVFVCGQVLATCQEQLRTALATNIKAALQLPSVDPALLSEVGHPAVARCVESACMLLWWRWLMWTSSCVLCCACLLKSCISVCAQAVDACVEQNMELCSLLFQRAAVDRAVAKVDEALSASAKIRKQFAESGSTDPNVVFGELQPWVQHLPPMLQVCALE